MPTTDVLLERIDYLEGLLLEHLELYQGPGMRALGDSQNSTFEGGKDILDIVVSDEVEDLITRTEMAIEEVDGLDFDFEE